ncbi:hypothetical protein BS47DRAFT_1488455 [Hydnum rufescens UP504]|uniref:AAA+ ATPase domain-containing protein n=1 Tax=Hydnum rufescens UP504 TaxID=1448309 RepID=A0A9P6AMS1_9AGAM|nr:hypothetical protein BS47DRAFT_1488455 [Hydnum rufescens UP504]
MEISGSNTLNRSVQAVWANHRKTRLNLNSTTSPASAATPAAVLSPPIKVPQNASKDHNAPPDASYETTGEGSQSNATDSAPKALSGLEDQPATSNGKRKSRTAETSSKRHKPSSVTGSGVKEKRSPPLARLSDMGGVQPCVEKMLELVAMPICHPEVYIHTGVQPPRGVLLHGPPGCGKTLLAHAIAGELGVPFICISAPSIVSGMSGESEKTLREAFEEAQNIAPCILFIDEIDAITPKRESAQREMERRIVAQFLTCMDELSWDRTGNKPVMVIGATNRPDALDSALRRAGRFDHEISMSVPDEQGREQILRVQGAKLRLTGNFDFRALAKATPGYVGADLSALTGAAGVIAVKRIFRELAQVDSDGIESRLPSSLLPPTVLSGAGESVQMILDTPPPSSTSSMTVSLEEPPQRGVPLLSTISDFLQRHPNPLTEDELAPLTIRYEDFISALSQVQPSSKREGFATIPDVTWADIGALHSIREELHMAIVQPIRRPEVFKAVGITAPCGVLLWGPPGCGKTLLAKAVANESRANFISVKGPELLNKYVGESERAVRQVFSRAAASSPCIIFFDELDALVPRRDDSLSESSARLVNTLLTELDGLSARKDVYVIAATNRPDMIDPAMCRPGRLDKLLYVDLPDADERAEILRTVLRKVPLAGDIATEDGNVPTIYAVQDLVRKGCEGYSGADLAALVREAGVLALRETLAALDAAQASYPQFSSSSTNASTTDIFVTLAHFEHALRKVMPSVSTVQRRKYEALRSKFAGLPVRGGAAGGLGDVDGRAQSVANSRPGSGSLGA